MTNSQTRPITLRIDGDRADEQRIVEILTDGGIKPEAIHVE